MKSLFSFLRARESKAPFRIFLLSVGLFLIVELLNHGILTDGLAPFFRFLYSHPWTALLDIALVFLTLVPALFFRRQLFYCAVVSVLWLTAGGVNAFILLKRSTPFTVSDLSQVWDGLDTLPNYLPLWAIVMLGVLFVLILAAIVFFFLRGPKCTLPASRRIRQGLIGLLAASLFVALFWSAGAASNQISSTFGNLSYAYNDYGFPYCFLQTWLNRGIHRPKNYNSRMMAGIAEKIPPEQDSAGDVNILFIQLESLLDPNDVEGLTLSGDVMPNLHRLMENYSSGFLTVPVVGAATANTEFEILTGMSCRFFGPGEYPYKSVVQKIPVESVASDLSSLGYTAHAIHNNRAAFYERDTVYANLGFHDYTSLEYMPADETTPNGWAKDGVLTSQILQALDATEGAKDFVFTVTVQCHGNYPMSRSWRIQPLTVETCPENINANALTYYVNQLSDTDAFVGELIAALEDRDEPTIAVFYGDHLPSLNLEATQLESGSMYQTRYVVWDNLGLTQEDENLSAFQLSAEILDRLGLSIGTVFRFHQGNQDTASYQSDLEAIQYDLLYGRQYLYADGGAPVATDLILGISDISITEIIPGDNCFFVLGTNFTPYCHVAADDTVLDTVYMTDSVLRVDEDLSEIEHEELSIHVIGKRREFLSETGEAPAYKRQPG